MNPHRFKSHKCTEIRALFEFSTSYTFWMYHIRETQYISNTPNRHFPSYFNKCKLINTHNNFRMADCRVETTFFASAKSACEDWAANRLQPCCVNVVYEFGCSSPDQQILNQTTGLVKSLILFKSYIEDLCLRFINVSSANWIDDPIASSIYYT